MSSSLLLPTLLIALAGAAVSAQPAFNAQLAEFLNSPVRAALCNFLAGATVLGLVVLALTPRSAPWPPLRELAAVPAHLWFIGGTLGATFVVTALWAAPKIGAGVLFSTLVAAPLCTSLVFDHFGLLGLPEKAANLQRVAGAGLLIAGAVLMARG